MTLIICLDDADGAAFAGRRQSTDRSIYWDIAELCRGSRLFTLPYSEPLFEGIGTELFVGLPGPGDCFFLEGEDPAVWAGKADRLIVYRWGRRYPAGVRFSPAAHSFRRTDRDSIQGLDHKALVREVYIRA